MRVKQATVAHQYFNSAVCCPTACQSLYADIMTDYPRVTSALKIKTSLTVDQGNHMLALH